MQQFSRKACVALVAVGTLSGIMSPLQATLLPQLVKEGHLSVAAIGQVAMAEGVGTMLAVTFANALIRPNRLRLLAVGGAVVAMVLDFLSSAAGHVELLALRFGHGLCAGLLLWLWMGFLARSDNPGRWAGTFLTAAALFALAATGMLSAVLLPWGGTWAGYALVGALFGSIALLAPLLPDDYEPLGHAGATLRLGWKSWVALLAVLMQVAASVAVWVYIKPLGTQIGLSEQATALAISVGLAGRIAGGLLATALAGRFGAARMILVVVVASVGSIFAMALAREAAVFIAAVCVFSLMWVVAPASHAPYLIDVDPTRRTALHMLTVQLLGGAAGPAIASLFVHGADVSGVPVAAMALFAVSGVVVVFTGRRPRVSSTPA